MKSALRRLNGSGLRRVEQIVSQQDRARRHEASAARRALRLDGWAQFRHAVTRARNSAQSEGKTDE